MLILRKRAYARAGLVGNPSDGYGGKTISILARNFHAEVVLYEWDEVEILLSEGDRSKFTSVRELARDVKLHGYYGGMRLIKATVKRFVDYCVGQNIALHDRNFSVRYTTTIPRGVGLSGSSAIVVATLRCLMDFYKAQIPLEVQPSLALAVEKDELRISAGLQDRVVQVYEGMVFMDFANLREIHGYDCGVYEPLDPTLLPPLYLAYSRGDVAEAGERIESSNVVHASLRERFDRGDQEVRDAMQELGRLTVEARAAILARDYERLAACINRNFDIRRSIYPQMLRGQILMVEVARSVGASAHFAGSGGAILGIYRDEDMYHELKKELGKINCLVLKPMITGGH